MVFIESKDRYYQPEKVTTFNGEWLDYKKKCRINEKVCCIRSTKDEGKKLDNYFLQRVTVLLQN